MEQITRAAGTLCTAVMIMGVLYELGCFPATEKVIKFIISIYILLTMSQAVSDTKFQFNYEQYNTQVQAQYSRQLELQLIQETEKELTKIIENRLQQKNISYKSVLVHILEQNGSLTADTIDINCPQQYIKQVQECISDLTTDDTKVNIGEQK